LIIIIIITIKGTKGKTQALGPQKGTTKIKRDQKRSFHSIKMDFEPPLASPDLVTESARAPLVRRRYATGPQR